MIKKVRHYYLATRYMNPWIVHVKEYASKHNMSYSKALKDPNCKATYSKK